MVMRNRHDGADTPNWWDDLPPGMRKRFANTSRHDASAGEESGQAERDSRTYQPGIIRDLSRLAALFVFIAVANLLFLLIALTFLFGGGPLPR